MPFTSDDVFDDLVAAMANTARDGRHLMTISAGTYYPDSPLIRPSQVPIVSSVFDAFTEAEDGLLVVGTASTRDAGAASDSFIYVPVNTFKVQMWDYQVMRQFWCGGTLFNPIFCTELIPEDERYTWKAVSLSGDSSIGGAAYAQAVASGAAAVLRSAYPYLSAAEIKSLILTTARDLGAPGVDEVYGHGALDLDRATQPVGELVVAQGRSVDGAGPSLQSTRLRLGPAFGDALETSALLAAGVAFDDFGRPFTVGLDQRVDHQDDGFGLGSFLARRGMAQGSTRLGDRETLHLATETADPERPWATGLAGLQRQEAGDRYTMTLDADAAGLGKLRLGIATTPRSVLGLSAGPLALVSDDLGFLSTEAAQLPQLDLVGGGAGISLTRAVAPTTDLVLGLDGSSEGVHLGGDARHAVQAVARHRFADNLTLGLGVGLLDEEGTFLASESGGAFGDDARNQAAFGSLLGRYAKGNWSLEGSWTVAAAKPDLAADGMLGDLGTVHAESWALGVIRRGVFDEQDRIGLMLSQPFRVASASGTLDVPVSRDFAGNVIRASERVSLEPSGREIDLELAYARQLGPSSSIDTHAFLRHEPGHDAGADLDLGLVARLSRHW